MRAWQKAKPYVPKPIVFDFSRGEHAQFFNSQSPEIVIAGAAGTGKSVLCLMRLHFLCEQVPGLRCLMVRKTRESLTESALVTYEKNILRNRHPVLEKGGSRRMRQSYVYPNGSQITLGGMDNPTKIMSTEYDIAYVQESVELTEAEWESISSRLRNGRLPYQQIMGDTNPDAPTHWIKQRAAAGRLQLFSSRHIDNPHLYDGKKWTPEGEKYLSRLEGLTGPRRDRLLHGRWAGAEGVIYTEYNPNVNLLDRSADPFNYGPPPIDWPRYWSVDFGYTHPFALLMCAKDHDGRLYVYRELYHTRMLVEDHIQRATDILKLEAEHFARLLKAPLGSAMARIRPQMVVADSADAEGRATIEKYLKMTVTPCNKRPSMHDGIQLVQKRFQQAPDGKPRLYILRDCLDKKDRRLRDDLKHPTCLAEELDAYVWNEQKDMPIDKFNHGADALRYLVISLDPLGVDREPIATGAGAKAPFTPEQKKAAGEQPFRFDPDTVTSSDGRRGIDLFGR